MKKFTNISTLATKIQKNILLNFKFILKQYSQNIFEEMQISCKVVFFSWYNKIVEISSLFVDLSSSMFHPFSHQKINGTFHALSFSCFALNQHTFKPWFLSDFFINK